MIQNKKIDIEKLKREDAFIVEEAYFQNFPKQLLSKINTRKQVFLFKPEYKWIAAAAAVLLLLFIHEFNNKNYKPILTEDYLTLYIEENIDLYHDDELFITWTDSEPVNETEQYLIENTTLQELEDYLN